MPAISLCNCLHTSLSRLSIARYLYENANSIRRNLTKTEIAAALFILKSKHKLTTSTVTDICGLLHLLKVPKAPKSFAVVKRILTSTDTNRMNTSVMHICSSCNKVFEESCLNPRCQSNSSPSESPTFLKFPIKKQIESILAVENNLNFHTLSSIEESEHKSDIHHGDWYRSILAREDPSNILTLLLNVDGVAVSESSDKSLWIFTVSRFITLTYASCFVFSSPTARYQRDPSKTSIQTAQLYHRCCMARSEEAHQRTDTGNADQFDRRTEIVGARKLVRDSCDA